MTKNFSQTAHKTAKLYESKLSEQFPVETNISMNDLVIQMKEAVSIHVTTSGLVYGLLSAEDQQLMSEFYTQLKTLSSNRVG